MGNYRAVITDLDNTLFDWLKIWHDPFRAMLDEIIRISGVEESELLPEIKLVHQKYGTSEYAFLIGELASLRRFSGAENPETVFATAIDIYRTKRREVLKLYPSVKTTLEKLKRDGTVIAAYTESQAFYTNYRIRKLGLDGLIDYIYSPPDHSLPDGKSAEQIRKYASEQYEFKLTKHRHTTAGEMKPNPAILLEITKDLRVAKEECIYIGDDLVKDVSMAKAAGVVDVWAKYGRGDLRPEYELLKQVTHWTPAMVETQKRTSVEDVIPSFVFEGSFSELLANFDFHVNSENYISAADRARNAIDVWKTSVDVQQHFNEIEMKVRGLAVTVVGALLGATAFCFKENLYIAIGFYKVPVAPVLPMIALYVLFLFYLMDRHWYHRFLVGAVKNAETIETKYADLIPALSLSKQISAKSPWKVSWLLYQPFSKNKEWHSDDKLTFVYRLTALVVGLWWALSLLVSFGAAGISSTGKADSAAKPSVVHATAAVTPPVQGAIEYFDPHNHLSGILPYQAYADLPAYISMQEGVGPGVTDADKEALYTDLKTQRTKPDVLTYTPTTRIGLGSRATLELYPTSGEPHTVSGSLERLLTATPFTEFDGAYKFRGMSGDDYLSKNYYSGDAKRLAADLCKATVLELARTHITGSEQSMNFIGGWRFKGKNSSRLQDVLCYGSEPEKLKPQLSKLGEPIPSIHILLMTHTAELAESADGRSYSSFVPTGRCAYTPWTDELKRPRTAPQEIERALLAEDEDGKLIVSHDERSRFFATVVGIDTAAPELTCFTKAGMVNYAELVDAVYQAAKIRRQQFGWRGKLLVHTHVGEGFTVYYGKHPPSQPWVQSDVFGALPDVSQNEITNSQAAHDNIDLLLAAIAAIEQKHPDIHDFLVFRLGHVTWADGPQAERMAREQLEADVNLDSNIATGAYPLSRMPNGDALKTRLDQVLSDPVANLRVNDFPHFVIPDPNDVDEVGGVLGKSSLKYLLMAHVRVLLGSDGAGVEHSEMSREYAIATSLIKYWDKHDIDFRARAGHASEQDYFDNVRWHLDNMAADAPLSYR